MRCLGERRLHVATTFQSRIAMAGLLLFRAASLAMT